MNARFLWILIGFATFQTGGAVQAQNGPPMELKPDQIRQNAVKAHQLLAKQFAEFLQDSQVLRQKLQASPSIVDNNRALQLHKALAQEENLLIRLKFFRLQYLLRMPEPSLADYRNAAVQSEIIARDLADLAELFENDNSVSEEIQLIEPLLKDLKRVIKIQQ